MSWLSFVSRTVKMINVWTDCKEGLERVRAERSRRGQMALQITDVLRPVHLLRVVLLRVLESNFPGDSLQDYTDMRIPTPEN